MTKYLFIFTLIIGCRSNNDNAKHLWDVYNASYSNVFLDVGVHNTLNDDNRVYTSNKVVHFDYEIQKNNSKYIVIAIVDTCSLLDGYCFSSKLVPKNHLNQYFKANNFPIENLKLTVFETTGIDHSLASTQTLVRYEAYNRMGTVKSNTEITGVIENPTRVMLHPPRSIGFEALQLCPFPEIDLNKPIKYRWNNTMYIPEETVPNIGWLNIEKERMELFNTYYIDSIHNRLNHKFYKIIGKSQAYNFESNAIFYFDTENGFTQMIFSIGDSISYNLKLKFK